MAMHNCSVSIQGLHPLKDLALAVFKGETFGETLLTVSTIVIWDGLAIGAFPGCVTGCFTLTSRFLPPRPTKVTIHAMHVTIMSLSFIFIGRTEDLGIHEATKDSSGASSQKEGKEDCVCGLHLKEPLN